MAYKPKYQSKNIHKSQIPSTTSTPSRSCSKSRDQKSEVVETSPSSPEVVRQLPYLDYIPKSPKVYYLIQKME